MYRAAMFRKKSFRRPSNNLLSSCKQLRSPSCCRLHLFTHWLVRLSSVCWTQVAMLGLHYGLSSK